jgi:tetratricopeptide (TPR) repeat protein
MRSMMRYWWTLILTGVFMGAGTTKPGELPGIDKLWDYSDAAGSERKFREVLPPAEKSGDDAYRAELLTQIARAQGRQGHFQEAHQTLDAVEKMLTEGMGRARVRYLLERGRVFNSSGEAEKGLPLFREAVAAAERCGEVRLQIDAVHMVAIAEKEPGEQLKWNLLGLELVEKHPEMKGWLPALYNNTGETYLLMKEYGKALEQFQKLAGLDAGDVFARKDVGKCLRLLGKYDEAVAMLAKIDDGKNGWVKWELAEALLAQGKKDAAREHFARAYELLSKDIGVEKVELERLRELGGK